MTTQLTSVALAVAIVVGSSGSAGTGFWIAPIDAWASSSRYRAEYALLEVPAVVQRIVIPIYFVGTVLGKYRRVKESPAPIPANRVISTSANQKRQQ